MAKEFISGFITTFFGMLLLVGCISAIMAFPTMWLWNWIMPTLCGFGKLSVWKALGLNFLCGILFNNDSNSKS